MRSATVSTVVLGLCRDRVGIRCVAGVQKLERYRPGGGKRNVADRPGLTGGGLRTK
jgi:hypothetical protein